MFDQGYTNPLGFEEASQGKSPVDVQEEIFKKKSRERYEYCLKMASIFKSKQGKEVLSVWRENTIESSSFSPTLAQQVGLDAANAHAYAREGQNAFVRDIESCIEIARTCKTLDQFTAAINQLGTVNKI